MKSHRVAFRKIDEDDDEIMTSRARSYCEHLGGNQWLNILEYYGTGKDGSEYLRERAMFLLTSEKEPVKQYSPGRQVYKFVPSQMVNSLV